MKLKRFFNTLAALIMIFGLSHFCNSEIGSNSLVLLRSGLDKLEAVIFDEEIYYCEFIPELPAMCVMIA